MKYNIDRLILFGGSRLLADCARYAKRSLPYELFVFSSKRHLDEVIPGEKLKLRKFLQKEHVKFYESEDINRDKSLPPLLTKKTLGIALGAAWVFEKNTVRRFQKNYFLDFIR